MVVFIDGCSYHLNKKRAAWYNKRYTMRMFIGTTIMLFCFIIIGIIITRTTSVLDADQFVESCFNECSRSSTRTDMCSREKISAVYKLLQMNTETFNTCVTEGFESRDRCMRTFRNNGKHFYKDFKKICPATYEPMHRLIFNSGEK